MRGRIGADKGRPGLRGQGWGGWGKVGADEGRLEWTEERSRQTGKSRGGWRKIGAEGLGRWEEVGSKRV